jgi:hypothetical protein
MVPPCAATIWRVMKSPSPFVRWTFRAPRNGSKMTGRMSGATAPALWTRNANGSLGAWSTSTNPLPASLYTPGLAANGTMLVVLAGSGGPASDDAIYFAAVQPNGDLGPWTTSAATLPAGRYYNTALSPVVGGRVYVMGGRNVSNQEESTVFYAAF